MSNKFEIKNEEIIFECDFLNVKNLRIVIDRFEGGRMEFDRFVVKKSDAVCITLFDKNTEQFLLIKQFCSAAAVNDSETDPWLIQSVAGHIDGNENPEESAIREIEEETDIVCDSVQFLCKGFTSPGIITEIQYHYLAQFDSSKVDLSSVYGLDDENIKVILIKKDDVLPMIANMEIRNSNAIIGLTMSLLTMK